jgi:hypothetical protein
VYRENCSNICSIKVRVGMTSTPILHPGPDRVDRLATAPRGRRRSRRRRAAVRRYDDPVEVRKGADEDPDQFLWKGRLWQVREVVAHWVETGAWWTRPTLGSTTESGPADGPANGPAGGGAADGDLLREREVWRVAAARGRVAALQSPEHDPGFGVFDLVFSWSEGSWQLVRAMD